MSTDNLPSDTLEPESQSSAEETNLQHKCTESTSPSTALPGQLDWAVLVLGFCMASATEIALQSLQAQLPWSVHLVSMAMVFAFASIFMAKFVPPKYPDHAKLLEYGGIFSAATAFFLAITIALPLSLKIMSWSIYALVLLAVFSFHVLPLFTSRSSVSHLRFFFNF